MLKRKLQLLLIIMFMFLFMEPVNAVNFDSGTCYYFNKTTGAYSSSGGRDCVKKMDGKYVYCTQWKLAFGTGSKYKKDTSWNSNTKNAIIAGIMIDLVQEKYEGVRAYHMTAAVLNTYFAKALKSSGSRNFYDTNNTIKGIYNEALEKYKKVVLSTNIGAPSFSVGDSVLNYSSGAVYISDKITLTGLKATVGGSSDKVTYTITPSATKGSASICTGANGTGCQKSVTLSGTSNNYSFYVMGSGMTHDDVITINVSGKNASKYATTIQYVYGSNKQKVVARDEITVNRSTGQSLQLTVPNLNNHRIVGYKVNEVGELLSGSTLEIYKDDATVAGNRLAISTEGSNVVSYTSPTVSTGDDDFFKHNYYLVEKNAPDGYVLNSKIKDIYIYDPKVDINKNSEKCYYNGNDNSPTLITDMERCNFAAYEYKCLATPGGEIKDLSENENCDFSTPDTGGDTEPPTPETREGEAGTTPEGGTEGGSTGETGEEPKPEVTYEKICYNNIKKARETDETYCSDKGKYTKVSKTSGNLVVTQVNVKNNVKISKRALTGDEEVEGATLKICTADSYNTKKQDCDVAKTIHDVEMTWVSGNRPNEFVGLKKGDYYIIEITPPKGYITATLATPFSIDEKGEVKSGSTVAKDNLIVIKNKLNSFTVSKQDIATSKELPGATISICNTYRDEDGVTKLLTDQYDNECIPAILADGKEATWISTDKPKEISGLPAGTYYLVERIAPTDYSTAESIMFVMKQDGTIADPKGNSLKDNKLVMHDQKLKEVKTGMEKFYRVLGIFVIVLGLGGGTFYFMKRTNGFQANSKIRKRKIHKINI